MWGWCKKSQTLIMLSGFGARKARPSQPPPGPDKLVLKGISWTVSHPLAIINNQSFAPGESGKVRVGTTNVNIRCLAVQANSARIQILPSGEELELSLNRLQK